MLFDTLELSRALQPSFTAEQAEALVQALSKASDRLATKADIAELRADFVELRADFVDLRAEFVELKSATKADIAELRADVSDLRTSTKADTVALRAEIATLRSDLTSVITTQISQLRSETIKWIVSALAFNFVATAGLIITLTKVFGR